MRRVTHRVAHRVINWVTDEGTRCHTSGHTAGHASDHTVSGTAETSPGALRHDVESSVQKRCGAVGEHPVEDHKNDRQDGTSLQQGQTERAGAVQSGEGSKVT